jgi:predicted cupin superfamily sugar epimerase
LKARQPAEREAGYWIAKLGLIEHPEGGYYRETYRSPLLLDTLPADFSGPRSASTAIYFLLCGDEFSALHRIRSDELWHFYVGGSLTIHCIYPEGLYSEMRLGPDSERGEVFQAVVRAGCWFGATLRAAGTWALVGCTVAPGFDFRDFELAVREELIRRYPQHRVIIQRLTRTAE